MSTSSPKPPPVKRPPVSAPPVGKTPAPPPEPTDSAETAAESPDQGESFSLGRILRMTPAWLASSVFHLLLVIAMAFIIMPGPAEDEEVVLNTTKTDPIEEELENFEDIELEIPEEIEINEASVVSEIDPGAMAFGDLTSEIEAPIEADVGIVALEQTTIDEIGSLLGKNGDGFAEVGDGMKAAATFFGAKAAARNIVFVVDNSNSMGRGKLETALIELNKAIGLLQPSQRFYIIFYSDTAYPLFHPNPAKYMIPATNENKRKVEYWLNTIEMCLRTDGIEALTLARKLRPDLVYVLGDGAFTDKAAQYVINQPIPYCKIHTLGMEVREKDAVLFEKIAKTHKGVYRDVGVTPEGKAMFDRFGSRPKNNSRGPVWGIKLKK